VITAGWRQEGHAPQKIASFPLFSIWM